MTISESGPLPVSCAACKTSASEPPSMYLRSAHGAKRAPAQRVSRVSVRGCGQVWARGAAVARALEDYVHGALVVEAVVERHEPRECRAVQRAQLSQQLIALRFVEDVDDLDGELRLGGRVHGAAHERRRALPKDLAHLEVLQMQPHHTVHLCPVDCGNALPIDDKVLLDKGARLREGEGGRLAHVDFLAAIQLDLHRCRRGRGAGGSHEAAFFSPRRRLGWGRQEQALSALSKRSP